VGAKKYFLITTLSILALLLLGLVLILFLYNPEKPVKINASSFTTAIDRNEVARLLGNAFAYKNAATVLGAKTPIEVKKEGSVKKTEFPFNALAPAWEVDTPENTEIILQIRVSRDGQNWSEWKTVEEDEDGDAKDDVTSARTFGRLVVIEGEYIQERIIFRTNSLEKIPEVKNLEFTYIDSKEKLNLLEKILKNIKLGVKKVFAAGGVPKRPTDKPNICSRACWGADEKLRKWSPYYAPLKKMVVHHTVTSNNDPNPKATVRAIYYFHAVIHGWGDIGYNFLVDQNNGTIYEGRYGGDEVIAAHALGYNTGSVGVGVLGDFRFVSPNKKVRNSLHKIAVWKLYKHSIDPDKKSYFGSPSKKVPYVFFHGQVANTACAGTNLNNFAPSLKKLAHYMPQQILLRDSSGVRRIEGGNNTTVTDLLVAYKNRGTVAPNYIRKISAFPSDGTTPPNDPNYSSQWDLPKLDALNVWQQTTGGDPSIKVAVLDTGVAYEDYDPPGSEVYAKGPDFSTTNFVAGYDYVNGDTHPNDDHSHGTAVASVIAETTNNSLGSASIAYNVSIMPVKVCDLLGWCLDSEIAKGMSFASKNGVDVINLSIGGPNFSSVIQSAINSAWDRGIVIVAASGNEGANKVSYPGRGFHVLGVGALTSTNSRASYSNYGSDLDLSAPGGDGGGGSGDLLYQIVSCTSGLDCTSFSYARIAGTSFASPLVSASAALVLGSAGNIGNAEVVDALINNAQDLGSPGRDNQFGYGMVQPADTISNAASPTKTFGVIKNDSKDYNFYSYNVPNQIEARGVIGADFWNITSGNKVVAATEIKISGVTKVGVVKNEGGDYNFYLYNMPNGIQGATSIGADYWNIPSGNNVVSIAGVDTDGDGTDEVAVMKKENGDYNLYIYRAPSGTQATNLVGKDLWNIPSGNNTVALAGLGDVDGDGKGELGVMKNKNGDFNFFVYDPPVGTQAMSIKAADYWNIPSGNNVVDIDGVGDINGDSKNDLAIMKKSNNDYNLFLYTIPSTIEGTNTFAADYWEIPAKNNTLFIIGNK